MYYVPKLHEWKVNFKPNLPFSEEERDDPQNYVGYEYPPYPGPNKR